MTDKQGISFYMQHQAYKYDNLHTAEWQRILKQ